MGQPYHLIVNPVAGRGFAARARAQVESFFAERGLRLEVHATAYPGHAHELTAALPQSACVLALGGDGTVHEVAAACLGTERVLGVLPAGSGDDFAVALGLEHHGLAAALAAVLAGKTAWVDSGRVNGRPFFNALGSGFDADVAYAVRHAPSVFRGRNAYFYAILSTLGRLEAVGVEVEADGAPFYAGPALLVSLLNGPRVAGAFLFAPEARVDDGLLDVVVAGRFGRLGTLGLLPRVIKGRHLGHPEIHHTRARRVAVRWARPRVAHMEGELLPASERFDIELCARDLCVFVPSSQPPTPAANPSRAAPCARAR